MTKEMVAHYLAETNTEINCIINEASLKKAV